MYITLYENNDIELGVWQEVDGFEAGGGVIVKTTEKVADKWHVTKVFVPNSHIDPRTRKILPNEALVPSFQFS